MANKSTFNKTLSMLNIVGLKESINSLMTKEGKYAPVASVCKAYLKKLNEGMHEEQICSAFVNDLTKVAIHDSAKDVVFGIGVKIDEHKRDIDIVNSLYEMANGNYAYVTPVVEAVLVDYMTNKNAETRTAARNSLSLFEGIKQIDKILEALSFDEYEEKTGKTLHNSSLNEAMLPKEEKTYTQDEVNEMLNAAKSESLNESNVQAPKNVRDIDSHIHLDNTIKSILRKEGKNEGLRVYCEGYIQALNSGKAEELLYESFISGLSKWNHLSAVDTEMSALSDRVSKYKQEVDLKKILNIMESTGSYYIVPLIEGVIVDYIDNKTMANKAILKQRLQAFEYDPFVRDILNVVMLDQSLEANVYLGESLENLNSFVHTEKVFSPVKYIKENECVFNVKGVYYNRKGNTITRLSKSSIDNLDESFKILCNLINHPAVSIDDLANTISIYEGKDSAKISDSAIIVNGTEYTTSELDNIANMSHLMNEHKEGFYAAIKMINEKFDEIAYIDFVKRVAMNESNGKTVDVFRIKNNLFVTTIDAKLGSTTFYRNVNPIQCRSYINEHMSINVSPLFEDILPNQHAILEGIEDAKKEYETYIEDLKQKKSDFEAMKDSADESADSDIDKAIKIIDDELDDVQKDYEQYKKDSEKYVGDDTDSADADTTSPEDAATVDTDGDADADAIDNPGEGEPAETPAEMEQPIDTAAEQDPMAAGKDDLNLDQDIAGFNAEADAEQAAVDSATPFDPDFDTVDATLEDKEAVKVLRISYASNVKTGKHVNKGTAFVVIPSVDANGDVKDETKSIAFYLDADRKPILNNEYMPLMVYNAIVSAISSDPDTSNIEVDGTAEVDSPATGDVSLEANVEISAPATEPAPADDIAMDSPEQTPDELSAPAEDQSEPMDGLEPDPEAPAPAEGDDTTDFDAISNSIDFDNFGDLEGGESMSDTDIDDLLGSSDTPADDNIPAAEQESPAATAERSTEDNYPIEVGLNTNDIKPISAGRFTEALKEMGIECSQCEGEQDTITMKFKNKAEVYALQDYFKDWKNYSQAEFCSFFPELKNCFANKPKVPVAPSKVTESFNTRNTGVQILGVHAINESQLFADSRKGTVSLILPYNEDYAKMFGYAPNNGEKISHIKLVTESFDETADVYKKLSTYAANKGNNLDEDAREFLDRYANDFEDINESNVYTFTAPYNGTVVQKLTHKGIFVDRVNEGMKVSVHKEDYAKAKKILENLYGTNAPVSVKNFFQFAEHSLNEGLKITIQDDKSGKTIVLDTDDMENGKKEDGDSSSVEQANFTDSFKDTTFDPKNSALFNASDDDSDDDEKDEDKDKKDDDKSSTETEEITPEDQLDSVNDTDEQSADKKEETEEKKPKKKFMFKKKKTPKDETSESVKPKSNAKHLNESATANVLDWVRLRNGKKGQVIASLPMSGHFIVNVDGHTVEVTPGEVELLGNKKDLVEAPFRFDKNTLAGLYEHMVQCGMFINGNRLTPSDCYVKYSDFINSNPDDKIRLVIEGDNVMVDRKYVNITENVNNYAIPQGFINAEEISDTGVKLRDILANADDITRTGGQNDPVTVLVKDAAGEYQETTLPRSSVKVTSM